MASLRTRFAPSPTGFLHIGAARTALFNWAYARHHGGEFVLRIEDTDRERSTRESERSLLSGLEWLGLEWDIGPYRQSERGERHAEVIRDLLANGSAYRCVCTKEELEERRGATIAAGEKWTYDGRCRNRDYGPECGPHTVRLRLPESGALAWDDLVFGPSGQDASEIGDRIIQRADGTALYHLSVVVDDLDMQISHVIRGADHQPNTPFHIALYRALGETPPAFAHVPLILSKSGKKLSKRRDPVSIEQFRSDGYLAAAVRNWIVRIGWSHGDQELFSREEIIEFFDLGAVGRAGARADSGKLAWLNHHYIQTLPAEELVALVLPYLEQTLGTRPATDEALQELVDLNRQRGKTLIELAEHCRWLYTEPIVYDDKAARKHLTPSTAPLLEDLEQRLGVADPWTQDAVRAAFDGLCEERGLKLGKLAQPVRVALTGGTVSPGIYDTLRVVGRGRSLSRLAAAAAFASQQERPDMAD
jgi:glutamyl-tRNA synthetase